MATLAGFLLGAVGGEVWHGCGEEVARNRGRRSLVIGVGVRVVRVIAIAFAIAWEQMIAGRG